MAIFGQRQIIVGLETSSHRCTASPVRAASLFVSAGALATAAIFFKPSLAVAREVVATEAQRGSTVRVRLGDRLRLTLPANGTTGFTWTLVQMPPHLRRVAGSVEAPAVPPSLVGAEGRQIFIFKTIRSGSGVLRLRYLQPWKRGMTGESVVLRIESGK